MIQDRFKKLTISKWEIIKMLPNHSALMVDYVVGGNENASEP